MRRLMLRKIMAAVLMLAVVLSCTGFESVQAEPNDEDVIVTDAAEDADEATAEEVDKATAKEADEAVEEKVDEASAKDTAADTADKAAAPEEEELSGDTSSVEEIKAEETEDADKAASGLKIKEIAKLPVSKRIISVPVKGTLEEAVGELPKTWTVTLEDGTEKDVKVSWTCKDDFDDKAFSSFVFEGSIDDDTVAPVDKKLEEDLVMEIRFEDAVETDGDFIINRYSRNSLTALLDIEQGTNGATEAFTNAYGNGDEISTNVSYASSKTVLSESAYNIFKGISPTPDNYLYNKLTVNEKSFYNGINNAVADYLYYGKKITLGADGEPLTELIASRNLTDSQMRKIFYMYYYDNPQAFFLTTKLSITGESEYDLSMRITLYPDTNTSTELLKKAEKIAKNIKSLSKKVNKASGEYNKAKEAQKLLCKRLTFDDERSISKKWQDWTVGSAMYDKSIMSVFYGSTHKTIDGGYAKSFTAIVRLAGLDIFGINSSPSDPRYTDDYEWNKIRLYGEWFCADLTADDTDDLSGDGCTYDHFLKSDKTINMDGNHTWAEKWKNIAPASSRDYSTKTKKYKITYKLNGGTNSIYNPSHYTANSTTITLRAPEKKGRKFKGFYTDDGYNHKITKINGKDKRDYTLYTKWVLVKYKVKYKLESGAKNAKGNPKSYNITKKTIKLKDPTRKGYVFKGWYTDKAKTQRIKKIKGTDCKNYTLYPKWKLKKYKLTYKVEKDVVNKDNPKHYTIKTKTFELEAPTRPGYDFVAWYTDKGLTKKITKIDTKKLKDYTLYPKWKMKDYKISYHLNGGKNSSKNPKKYNVKSGSIKLADPTRSGYTFGGWYKDEALTQKIKTVRGRDVCDYDLYAKWIKK